MSQIFEILGELEGRPWIIVAATQKDVGHAQQLARSETMF
jgi:hypothetical protein